MYYKFSVEFSFVQFLVFSYGNLRSFVRKSFAQTLFRKINVKRLSFVRVKLKMFRLFQFPIITQTELNLIYL
jgi:hypothetical protein